MDQSGAASATDTSTSPPFKRPAFQWYPGDWLRATETRVCSLAARGLWIDMICLMHEGRPYGHLRVGTMDIQPGDLARMVGAPEADVAELLALSRSTIYARVKKGTFPSPVSIGARAVGWIGGKRPVRLKKIPTPKALFLGSSASNDRSMR
jgi:hypothetical protein